MKKCSLKHSHPSMVKDCLQITCPFPMLLRTEDERKETTCTGVMIESYIQSGFNEKEIEQTWNLLGSDFSLQLDTYIGRPDILYRSLSKAWLAAN